MATGEDVGIERVIALAPRKIGRIGVERHKVSPRAHGNAHGAAQSVSATRQRMIMQAAPGGNAWQAHRIAHAAREALAVFQHPQLARCRDLDIRIRADAEAPARREEIHAREHAITQIGLGDGAEARHSSRFRQRIGLFRCEMRRVDQAPALVDRLMGEKPLHRSLAAPAKAILHFLHLLGDMDMDRAGWIARNERIKFFRRGRAQRMRRKAEHGLRQTGNRAPARLHQAREALEIREEAPLPRIRGLPAKAAMRVENRQ